MRAMRAEYLAMAAPLARSGQLKYREDIVEGIDKLSYSADGRLLAAGDTVRHLAVFRAEDGAPAAGFAPRKIADSGASRPLIPE
jgi:hypothetical protein